MVESILSRGDGVIDGRAEIMAKGAAELKGTAYLWQQVDAEGMVKAMGEVFPPKEEAASAGKWIQQATTICCPPQLRCDSG